MPDFETSIISGSRATVASALAIHRFFMRAGLSVSVFAWVFIFLLFSANTSSLRFGLFGVALTYALTQNIALLLTPIAARNLRRGTRHLLVQAVLYASLGFGCLAVLLSGYLGFQIGSAVLAFAILMGVYRAYYWVPYHVDSSRVMRGGTSHAIREIFFALLPAFFGAFIALGFPAAGHALWLAALLILGSLAPLFRVPDMYEGFSWGYSETFQQLFDSRHHRLVLASIADGISGATLLLFWPIAVFLIVGWSYATLGLVLTVTLLSVLLFRDLIRHLFRIIRIEDSIAIQAAFAASSWLMRLVVINPLGVVVVDTYHHAGAPVRRSGIDTGTFEQAADRGSYIDEYTVLKEISLSFGKILVCIAAAALVTEYTLAATFILLFILAGIASVASVLLSRPSSSV